MGKEEFASVTAAAQALGVSADTIRRWSKLGLIKSTRDKNQKRMFNLAELHRLRRKLNGEGDSTDYQILRADETFDDATCIDLFAGAGGISQRCLLIGRLIDIFRSGINDPEAVAFQDFSHVMQR